MLSEKINISRLFKTFYILLDQTPTMYSYNIIYLYIYIYVHVKQYLVLSSKLKYFTHVNVLNKKLR